MTTLPQVAVPQCIIEVYPFEGGPYRISGGMILSAEVEKNIRSDQGKFSIVLAPGGPGGPNFGPSWAEIITPFSLCVIGMQRGGVRSIVMVGVISEASESTKWTPEQSTERNTRLVGYDYGYFFAMWGYYSLFFLGLSPGLAAVPGQPEAGVATLAGALLQGTPAAVGQSWYTNVMAGTDGILAESRVPYISGPVSFPSAMATWFEQYKNYEIPFADYFISAEGSWLSKFRTIFPFPWYEFFVITAPPGLYPEATPAATPFQLQAWGGATVASPTLVARVNPNPSLITSGGNFTAADVEAWNLLPLFTLNEVGFIQASLGFSDAEVKNFFILNPTWLRALFGFTNSGTTQFPFLYSIAADLASIHRYGFRPADGTMNWLADPTGDQAATSAFINGQEQISGSSPPFNDGADGQTMVADLVAKLASWWGPSALMTQGSVAMPLRPDIYPGCRFEFQPFKTGEDMQFYIEGIVHRFRFGGACMTELTLRRGLPSTVYKDPAQLFNVLTGNARRQNGTVVAGAAPGLGTTLQPYSIAQYQAFLAGLAKIYATPGAQ